MSFSVVIPSRSVANLAACVGAIRAAGETCRIIVVDDGVDWNSWACLGLVTESTDRLGMEIHEGVQPFIFARNINIGIRAAGDDDVVILNDDALLESADGFTALHRASKEHPEYGIVSAATNNAGNPAQFRRNDTGLRTCPSPTPGNSFATVAYICVLIPRATINRVGLLDERFGGITAAGKRIYGFDDNDYSRRLHLAGMKIGIHDGCFVNHNVLPSTFRSDPYSMESGLQIYMEKWGSM